MRFLPLFLLLCLSAFSQQRAIRIYNASFVNLATGQIERNKSITISPGGRPTVGVPRAYDAKGAYLMPALSDMHVHAPDTLVAGFFGLLKKAGIYRARIMKASAEQAKTLRQNNPVLLDLCYNIYDTDTTSADRIPVMVAGLKQRGYDFIKCFSVRSQGYFDTLMQAAKAANLTVCGHALSKVAPLHALQNGYKSVEHLGWFDKASPAGLDSLLSQAKASGTYLCPTLDWMMMVYHTVPKDSLKFRMGFAEGQTLYGATWEKDYATTEEQLGANKARYDVYFRDMLEGKLNVLRKARALGVPVIAGSDAEEVYQTPGFSLIEELKWIGKAGYTNAELLRMVTLNPMRYYELQRPGAYILLEKNPLENLDNLATVIGLWR